jgi:two-component system response regulator AlgR
VSETPLVPDALRVLVVDDEPLARARLKTLLADCPEPAVQWVGEAGDAVQAMSFLAHHAVDVLLSDIHMPGQDGLALAGMLKTLDRPVAVVFVTAHAEHAVRAFELEAQDYLTKPVRLTRLQTALQKVVRWRAMQLGAVTAETGTDDALVVHVRGGLERVLLSTVVYLKAELKYVTVRTSTQSYLLEASLSELETRLGPRFVRVHRNALVATQALQALERVDDGQEGEAWSVRLRGVDERLSVSRRQLAVVRKTLGS